MVLGPLAGVASLVAVIGDVVDCAGAVVGVASGAQAMLKASAVPAILDLSHVVVFTFIPSLDSFWL